MVFRKKSQCHKPAPAPAKGAPKDDWRKDHLHLIDPAWMAEHVKNNQGLKPPKAPETIIEAVIAEAVEDVFGGNILVKGDGPAEGQRQDMRDAGLDLIEAILCSAEEALPDGPDKDAAVRALRALNSTTIKDALRYQESFAFLMRRFHVYGKSITDAVLEKLENGYALSDAPLLDLAESFWHHHIVERNVIPAEEILNEGLSQCDSYTIERALALRDMHTS